jgi:hypothetical protein
VVTNSQEQTNAVGDEAEEAAPTDVLPQALLDRALAPASWDELQQELYGDMWDENLNRFRSSYAYRGLGDIRYKLKNSLARAIHDPRALEAHLLRNFKKYAPPGSVPYDSLWNWLSVGQHHGLPTRILDWTYSPLVALHFATSNVSHADRDGVVWCVRIPDVHESLPESFRKVLDAEGAMVFTTEMLNKVADQLRMLEQLSRDPFVWFFEPPSIDARIVNQFALFSATSDPTVAMDEWLLDKDAFRLIRISKDLKWEVRDKLDQSNITERMLFPGLGGLSTWLTRHYSPHPDLLKRQEHPAG